MKKPTKIEMDGNVNFERAKTLEKLPIRAFNQIPEDERCGAWYMIYDLRQIFLRMAEYDNESD